MDHLLDVGYLFLLMVASPFLLYRAWKTGKYRRGWAAKVLGRIDPSLSGNGSTAQFVIWFHGVSVGEVHLLRQVVATYRLRHPDHRCVISTTTDTGMDEARRHFPDLAVFYWPLDFSWAVRRALRQVKPALVVLAEGELWPNFLLEAKRQRIAVAVINGRLSPRTLKNYRRAGRLGRWLFQGVDLFAAQTSSYADGYRQLGVRPDHIHVTGNVKYDGVVCDRANPRTMAMRHLLSVAADDLLWVVGSTQAPEEEIALNIFRRVRCGHPAVRLVIVPRQKDRFDEVARLLAASGLPSIRRSCLVQPVAQREAIILVDTIGELGAVWGLADIAFVGGSLDGRRGGQNMIEPAAFGAAVLFGPHVWNFRDVATRLVDSQAAIQVKDPGELEAAVVRLLADSPARQRLGRAARDFVQCQQGATARTMELLEALVRPSEKSEKGVGSRKTGAPDPFFAPALSGGQGG
jgi:3-deoxy-D-manno-octulosonic-acid transferase